MAFLGSLCTVTGRERTLNEKTLLRAEDKKIVEGGKNKKKLKSSQPAPRGAHKGTCDLRQQWPHGWTQLELALHPCRRLFDLVSLCRTLRMFKFY